MILAIVITAVVVGVAAYLFGANNPPKSVIEKIKNKL